MSSSSNYCSEDPFETQWILLIRLENVVANKFVLYKNLRKRFDDVNDSEIILQINNILADRTGLRNKATNENQTMNNKVKALYTSLDDAENSLLEFMSITNLVYQDTETDEYQLDSIFEHFDSFLITLEGLHQSLLELHSDLLISESDFHRQVECISDISVKWREILKEMNEWLADIHLIFGRFKRTRSLIEMILMQSISICMKYKTSTLDAATINSCKQKLIFWMQTVESWRNQTDTLCVEVASKAGHRKACSDMIGLRHRLNNLLKCLRRQLELFDPNQPFMGHNNSAKTMTSDDGNNKSESYSCKMSTTGNQYPWVKKGPSGQNSNNKGNSNVSAHSSNHTSNKDFLDEYTNPLSKYNIKKINEEIKRINPNELLGENKDNISINFNLEQTLANEDFIDDEKLCSPLEYHSELLESTVENICEEKFKHTEDDQCDSPASSDESVITQIEIIGKSKPPGTDGDTVLLRQRNLNNENTIEASHSDDEIMGQDNKHNQEVLMHSCHAWDGMSNASPRHSEKVKIPALHKKWLGVNFVTNLMIAPTDYLFLCLIFLAYILGPECQFLYECLTVSVYHSNPPPI